MIIDKQNKYWKVHKDNVKDYFDKDVNIYIQKKWLENVENNYIYVGTYFSHKWNYGYMYYNDRSVDYFKNEKYIYKGEFIPIKQERKRKLKKLYENR